MPYLRIKVIVVSLISLFVFTNFFIKKGTIGGIGAMAVTSDKHALHLSRGDLLIFNKYESGVNKSDYVVYKTAKKQRVIGWVLDTNGTDEELTYRVVTGVESNISQITISRADIVGKTVGVIYYVGYLSILFDSKWVILFFILLPLAYVLYTEVDTLSTEVRRYFDDYIPEIRYRIFRIKRQLVKKTLKG